MPPVLFIFLAIFRLLMKWRFEDRCAKQMDAIKKVLHMQIYTVYCIILYMYIYNTLSFLSLSLSLPPSPFLPLSYSSFPSLPSLPFILPLPSSLFPTPPSPPYPPYPSSFPYPPSPFLPLSYSSLLSLPPSLLLFPPLPSSLSPTLPSSPFLPLSYSSLLFLSPSLLLLQGINDIFPLSMLKIFDEREIEVSSIIQYAFRVLPIMIGPCIHYIHDHYLFKLCYLCTEIFN